jgi:hypothetical protein
MYNPKPISALKAMALSKREMPIELSVSLFIKPTIMFCFVFFLPLMIPNKYPSGIMRIFSKKNCHKLLCRVKALVVGFMGIPSCSKVLMLAKFASW